MPWQAFRRGDEWCVYKLGDDDKPTGETLGCHATKDEADAHVAALYANEKKAISLDEQLRQVQEAFYKAIRPATPLEAPIDTDALVQEVFDDHLVVSAGTSFWRVPYLWKDGGVTIAPRNEWGEIQEKYIPKAISDSYTVKSLGKNRIGGYLVMWGDPEHRDLTDEWFTPRTEGLLSIFKAVGKIPLLYHHGNDAKVGPEVVGAYDVMELDDIGVWAEAQLDLASKYREAIQKLVRYRVLGQSSQTLASARKVAPNGEIQRWVIVEGSLTPMPCEPRMLERPVAEIKAAYKSIGVEFPEQHLSDDGGEKPQLRNRELETIKAELIKIQLETMEL